MTRDGAIGAITLDNFKAFATSGAITNTDPDVMEEFIYHHFLGDDRPQASSTATRKQTCLELYNRAKADAKLTGNPAFLGAIREYVANCNDLLTQWCEWLDPEGGLEL